MRFVLCLLLSSCSLAGLDTFDIPYCESNDQCEVLNARDGNGPDACLRHQCDRDLNICKLQIRDVDRDGSPAPECADQPSDCDDNNDQRFPGNAEVCDGLDNDCDGIVDGVMVVEGLTPVISDVHDDILGYGLSNGVLGVLIHNDSDDRGYFGEAETDIESLSFDGEENLADGVIIGDGSNWLSMTLSDRGCSAGRLVLGSISSNNHVETSTTIDQEGLCTRGGATRPAIGLQQDTRQGVASWLSISHEEAQNRNPCAANAPIDVSAIGYFADDPGKLSGLVRLGATGGLGRPAVVDWQGDRRGTFVAFGNEGTGVAFHHLGIMDPASPRLTSVAATITSTIRADHVDLAVGHIRGLNSLDLGVTWHQECDFQTVWFAQVTYDGEAFTSTEPVRISGGRSMNPRIQYLRHRGMWLVAWEQTDAEDQTWIVARRISEVDGQPIDPVESVISAVDGSYSLAESVYLYRAGEELRFAHLNGKSDEIETGLLCSE